MLRSMIEKANNVANQPTEYCNFLFSVTKEIYMAINF